MTYKEVLMRAREYFEGHCTCCTVCDGRACTNKIPGPGAKGTGAVTARNYDAWQNIYLNMDTLCENSSVDTSVEIFGKKFSLPLFAGPVGSVNSHYGKKYDDIAYNEALVAGCKDAGIVAWTGDGVDPVIMQSAAQIIGKASDCGVPTIKPWSLQVVKEKIELFRNIKPFAMAMDIDAAGLPFLKGLTPKAGSKSVEEMRQIIESAGFPFIIKGVMSAKVAKKAIEAGASGIVVSNHGGRVLDGTPSTASVLPEIVDEVAGKAVILVDGGIRSGLDIFRAVALGANGVLMARPFVQAVFGGAIEGVKLFVAKIKAELEDTMLMTGASTIKDITFDKIRVQ